MGKTIFILAAILVCATGVYGAGIETELNVEQQIHLVQMSTSGMGLGGFTAVESSDRQLMRHFAGRYYNYSAAGMGTTSGSERHLIFCPDGRFLLLVISDYSDQSGRPITGNREQYEGNWQIGGNLQQGILTTFYSNGDVFEKRYRSCGRGCIYIGNTKYGYNGEANCR